ncbi:MAG TPA: DUF6226 family protein [Acidimicrobiales bacterium]
MVTESDLCAAVDAAFAVTGRGLAPWPDPHAGRSPLGHEYSRLTAPERWRIVGARADAWLAAVADLGLAAVEPQAEVAWAEPPPTEIARSARAVPHAAGALPLVVARSRIGPVADAGVTLGVGAPAVCVAWFPDCGCDACDWGSAEVLEDLDDHVLGVVSGTFRRLTDGSHEITVVRTGDWQASGPLEPADVDAVVADPVGWDVLAGRPWFGAG